jgi:hypothetical protein
MKTLLTTRVAAGLIVGGLVLGDLLIVRADLSDSRQLFSLLLALYLAAWGGYVLMTTVPRTEVRNQFVLTTFSLGVALAMLEVPVWFKLVNYREMFAISDGFDWEHHGYIPDKELLFKPKPSRTIRMQMRRGNVGEVLCLPTHQEAPFDLTYDKNGFRNERDLTSADIAVIGDSYVESQMMPSARLATTRLAALTKQTVANLGQSGYGPQQELAVLKRYALPLHPKTIVWIFYEGNDLLDARDYLNRGEALKATWGRTDGFWYRSFARNSLSWLTRTFQSCVPNPNEELHVARATIVDSTGKPQRLYVKGLSVSVHLSTQELNGLQETGAILEEAYRLVQQEGHRFMVVFAPHTYRVYTEIAHFEGMNGRATWPTVNDLPNRLRDIVASISPEIDYLDLTPALRSAARENTLVFFPDDTHWTAEGHRVVAAALAEAVTSEVKQYIEKPLNEGGMMNGIVASNGAMLGAVDRAAVE